MAKTAILFFLVILFAALVGAAAGGGFGALIGYISPDFATDLFGYGKDEIPHPMNYAATVGMVFGLFISASVAGFCCGLSALLRLLSFRVDYKSESAVK